MHEVTFFEYQSHQFRSITIDNEPWFVAKDVCDVLGLENVSKALIKIPDLHKGVNSIQTLGGIQKVNVIDEPGLYRLILRCNKPEAEPFMEWVTAEVLPAIRKTGSYSTDRPADKTVNINHHRNPRSPSGLDIRYTLDLTKVILNPTKKSLELLSRSTGLDLDDMIEEAAEVENGSKAFFLERFVNSCCRRTDQQQYVHLVALHAAYSDWFNLAEYPINKMATNKELSAFLAVKGYPKVKRGGRYRFHGLALIDSEVA